MPACCIGFCTVERFGLAFLVVVAAFLIFLDGADPVDCTTSFLLARFVSLGSVLVLSEIVINVSLRCKHFVICHRCIMGWYPYD